MLLGKPENKFEVYNDIDGELVNLFRVFFCDELGTMPPFDILPLFSAGRSRRLTLVPIIQSLAQLSNNSFRSGVNSNISPSAKN